MDEPSIGRLRRRHVGSRTTYQSGCRCDGCVEAQRVFYRVRMERRKAGSIPDRVVHGRYSTYGNWGCRCDACKEAARAYARAYGKVYEPLRSERRRGFDQAVLKVSLVHRKPWTEQEIEVAKDWSLTMRQVAQQLGRTMSAVDFMRRQLRGYVQPTSAERKNRQQLRQVKA